MKTILILITISLVLNSPTFAQNFWEFKGLLNKAVYDITLDSAGNIYTVIWNDGIYLSTNSGETWQKSSNGLKSLKTWSVKALDLDSVLILAGTIDSGLFKSSDFGANWISVGMSEWVSELAINSNNNIFLATISDGIYRSTDIGNSWQRVSDPMQVGNDVYSINVNTNNDVFAGTDACMFRSTDNGDTWDKIDSGYILRGEVCSIAFNNLGDIFIADNGGTSNQGSVYISTNNGNSWLQTSIVQSTLSLVTIPVSTIYASTSNGVFVSYDNGQTCQQINSGLTETIVYSLCLDRNGYLFAGTPNGIFRSVQSVTSCIKEMESLPSNFLLDQNYPNPFNPNTTIKYSIPKLSFVSIKIFDVLGSEVATLVNEKKPIGTYELNWSAANLSSGVYFYKLQAGDFVQTRKMILLK